MIGCNSVDYEVEDVKNGKDKDSVEEVADKNLTTAFE